MHAYQIDPLNFSNSLHRKSANLRAHGDLKGPADNKIRFIFVDPGRKTEQDAAVIQLFNFKGLNRSSVWNFEQFPNVDYLTLAILIFL